MVVAPAPVARAVAAPALSMSSRLTLVVGAALDIVGLGALFLQQTGEYRGDLPVDLPSLRSRLDHTLLDDGLFPWLVAASVFPVLGAAGAVCLWRPLLWLYCAFLVACIGAHARWTSWALAALLGRLLQHSWVVMQHSSRLPPTVRTGLRTILTFLASVKEGLEPRAPLLRDMCLLSVGIFLQVFLFRSAARLALIAGGPMSPRTAMGPRSSQRPGSQSARHSPSRTR